MPIFFFDSSDASKGLFIVVDSKTNKNYPYINKKKNSVFLLRKKKVRKLMVINDRCRCTQTMQYWVQDNPPESFDFTVFECKYIIFIMCTYYSTWTWLHLYTLLSGSWERPHKRSIGRQVD